MGSRTGIETLLKEDDIVDIPQLSLYDLQPAMCVSIKNYFIFEWYTGTIIDI